MKEEKEKKGIDYYTGVPAPEKYTSNASAINRHEIFGVSHLVALKIVVEGKQIFYYKSFDLSQSTQNHHEFKLVLSHDSLGSQETYQMEEAQKLLGKRLLVMFQFKNIPNNPEREFYGVITQVSFEQEHGSQGNIVLRGYSPTILLDGAPHIQSFGGSHPVSLSDVATRVMREGLGEGKYAFHVQVDKGTNMSYICQYNETHYHFLTRLAAAYGEQFFYDGKQLCFGTIPRPEEPIKLIYGRDVDQIDIRMEVRHVKRSFYGYNSLENTELSPPYGSHLEHVGSLAKVAYKKSETTYLTPSYQIAPIKASTHIDIRDTQKGVIGNQGTQVFVTTGVTTIPFLYPGCLVELKMTLPGEKTSNYFTQVIITHIKHQVDALGKYRGEFKAVAAHTGYVPQGAFTIPVTEAQIATVINNADPDNAGRVQVRFDWQRSDENTEFIRVLTPDAGSSNKVGKNRGFVFVPEINDQVMVGFVHGHPDKPYVMGGLFHGGIAAGGQQQNHLKTIITRSGCTIQIDDADNQGSITINDPSGNIWYMDGAGNIDVTAPGTMTLNSKNMNINVSENMNTIVGVNQSNNVGLNSTETVGAIKTTSIVGDANMFITGKLMEVIQGDVHSETKQGKTIVNSENGIETSSNASINRHAETELQNNSGEQSKNH